MRKVTKQEINEIRTGMNNYLSGKGNVLVDMGNNGLSCDNCLFGFERDSNGQPLCNNECITNTSINNLENEFHFIWGMLSYDDLSGADTPSLNTLNDVELIQDKETNKYFFSMETIYLFDTPKAIISYLENILKNFTQWMKENGYDTSCPSLSSIGNFSSSNYAGGYDTIEECYQDVKMKLLGYIIWYGKENENDNEKQ